MQQTFSLQIARLTLPRALPWASMNEPFGLEGRSNESAIDSQNNVTYHKAQRAYAY